MTHNSDQRHCTCSFNDDGCTSICCYHSALENELEGLREAGKIVEMIGKLRRHCNTISIRIFPEKSLVGMPWPACVALQTQIGPGIGQCFHAPTLAEALAAAVQSLESEAPQ